jgi:type II secretory pathway component PulF
MLSRVSSKDRLMFTQQLRTMLDSGIPLLRALMVLEEHAPSSKLRKITKNIIKIIQQGKPFSETLKQQGTAFPNYYIALIRVGENTGTLYQVLQQIERWLNEKNEYRRKLINISTYPLIVLAAMGVIPILIPYLLSPNGPTTDQFLHMLGTLIMQWGILIFGIIFIWRFYKKSLYRWESTKLGIQKLLLQIPIFGRLWRRNVLYQFYSLLSTTMNSGLPILSAIPIMIEGTDNLIIRQALFAAQEEIQFGGKMSDAFDRFPIFPKTDIQMIATGEMTGNLAGMVDNLHETYHTELFYGTKGLLSGLEPFLILIVALLVTGYIFNGFNFIIQIIRSIFRTIP